MPKRKIIVSKPIFLVQTRDIVYIEKRNIGVIYERPKNGQDLVLRFIIMKSATCIPDKAADFNTKLSKLANNNFIVDESVFAETMLEPLPKSSFKAGSYYLAQQIDYKFFSKQVRSSRLSYKKCFKEILDISKRSFNDGFLHESDRNLFDELIAILQKRTKRWLSNLPINKLIAHKKDIHNELNDIYKAYREDFEEIIEDVEDFDLEGSFDYTEEKLVPFLKKTSSLILVRLYRAIHKDVSMITKLSKTDQKIVIYKLKAWSRFEKLAEIRNISATMPGL